MMPLQIFEKHPGNGQPVYRVGGSFTPYAIVAVDKRFTDAELAAEWWASHGEANQTMTGNPTLLFSRRATILRFATFPHFDA
ncbi:hypothetical protein [Arthrobacter sp. ES3-54]|uniref:hypothetical protein n=1 Tax=Arthrobacter sp. ES3-54 TaxID=1502991 RepID=UPI002406604A|nr:hypothetical protein [Arthrobacter sp. ES3-54]MDF9748666.1 hypothetical protein [Arthrobacter sp. ES3-54]